MSLAHFILRDIDSLTPPKDTNINVGEKGKTKI